MQQLCNRTLDDDDDDDDVYFFVLWCLKKTKRSFDDGMLMTTEGFEQHHDFAIFPSHFPSLSLFVVEHELSKKKLSFVTVASRLQQSVAARLADVHPFPVSPTAASSSSFHSQKNNNCEKTKGFVGRWWNYRHYCYRSSR